MEEKFTGFKEGAIAAYLVFMGVRNITGEWVLVGIFEVILGIIITYPYLRYISKQDYHGKDN